MSDREFIGVDLAESDSSSPHTMVLTITPPAQFAPVPIPIDRVDICGPSDIAPASDVPGFSLQSIGDRVYPPGSSLVSMLVSKGSHAVSPVLPNGVQWVQAGRRYAAYRGNVHLGGIDPVTTGDPAHPLWVAYAKGNRNEITHASLVEAVEWVMENSANPGRLITDVLQEHIGPINLRLDRDGYRVAMRLKGTDNQLCIYMFDNRNATSQELRINIGLIPPVPTDAIAWLDTMVRGLKAGLQLYRDWSNVPGIEMDGDESVPLHAMVDYDGSYKLIRPRLSYSPPQPEQVIELDEAARQAMPRLPDLEKGAEPPLTHDAMDGITFVPREQGERAAWDEEDVE